ncbi:glycosyltransferase family 39 protein [Maribellus sp. YY47]|uniref:ArnT family glycosyltransferase n=1 Tax=Maribellus sp. YY47 TaxID=2929486 RepID=UPI0020019925|nr:glycosyltransferase family 39 protein [Maribellus sp. YY47]MCK3685480.1 glycosyltransferase family 39 protein [Maribellus sp. YY47]
MSKQFVYILLISLMLFFSFLGGTCVFQVAEARNSECAREMLEHKNWVVPTFNGELRTDKPALEYFGMMTSYLIGGINETSARFFSAFCGLLLVLFTFWFVKRNFNAQAAWWSSIVLLSSLHLVLQFRLATPDPYLILCHTLSIYFFYEGWKTGRWKWYAGMYIFFGLGILAKGPVGLLLPALSIFGFLLATKSFTISTLGKLKPWRGIALILLFSLPWYVAVHIKTGGEWTNGFFLEHNIQRFNTPIGKHGGSFLLPFFFMIGGMLPFSVFVIRAIKSAWKNIRNENVNLLATISILTVVVFYSVASTKLINYIAPAYPFLAIVIGTYLSKLLNSESVKANIKPELYVIFLLGLAIPAGAYFFIKNTPPFETKSWIALFFLTFPIGMFLSLRFYRTSLFKCLTTLFLTFAISTFIFFAGPFQIVDNQSPIEKYKAYIQSHTHTIAYKSFDPAFAFYAHDQIPVFTDKEKLKAYLQHNSDVLVLSRAKNLNYMDSIPGLVPMAIGHDLFSTRSSGFYHSK